MILLDLKIPDWFIKDECVSVQNVPKVFVEFIDFRNKDAGNLWKIYFEALTIRICCIDKKPAVACVGNVTLLINHYSI